MQSCDQVIKESNNCVIQWSSVHVMMWWCDQMVKWSRDQLIKWSSDHVIKWSGIKWSGIKWSCAHVIMRLCDQVIMRSSNHDQMIQWSWDQVIFKWFMYAGNKKSKQRLNTGYWPISKSTNQGNFRLHISSNSQPKQTKGPTDLK